MKSASMNEAPEAEAPGLGDDYDRRSRQVRVRMRIMKLS
jgi:hypothetical protein